MPYGPKPASGGGGPPSGAAGGDLSGTYPNPTVADISNATQDGVAVPQILYRGTQTGWLSGGVLSANSPADNKVDITAGTGVVVDVSDPENIVYTPVSWGATDLAITDIATGEFTLIAVDSLGAFQQVTEGQLTAQQRREWVMLGFAHHPDNATVTTATNPTESSAYDGLQDAVDLAFALGPINLSGNTFSGATGGSLAIQMSGGSMFRLGINRKTDPTDPNTASIVAADPVATVFREYRDGGGGWTRVAASTLDPTNYDDDSGVLQPVPGGSWTIQPVRLSGGGAVFANYGTATYPNAATAEAAITTEEATFNPLLSTALLRGWWILRSGGTDLTNPSDGYFVSASALGGAVAGGGGGGGGDLLAANNLSDVDDVPTARTNLGLGSAAVEDVGTGANNVVQLDGSGALPAVDGSAVTGVGVDGPGVGVYLTSDVSQVAGNTITNWTEAYDTDAAFSAGVFTVPAGKAGLYLVTLTLRYTANSSTIPVIIQGTSQYWGSYDTTNRAAVVTAVLSLAEAATVAFSSSGSTATLDAAGASGEVLTYGSIQRIGSAP